jgi:hypothetical protein
MIAFFNTIDPSAERTIQIHDDVEHSAPSAYLGVLCGEDHFNAERAEIR